MTRRIGTSAASLLPALQQDRQGLGLSRQRAEPERNTVTER